MTPLRIACLAVLGFAGAGCIATLARMSGPSGPLTEWSSTRQARYTGAECDQVLYRLAEIEDYNDDKPVADQSTHGQQVLLVSCARYQKTGVHGHVIPEQPKFREMQIVDAHFAFDDRRFDHLQAALMVTWVGQTTFLEDIRDRRYGWHERYSQPALFGLMKVYADAVDARALGDQLARTGVPLKARDVFLALFEDSKARIATYVAGLGEAEKRLYVQTPAAVLVERAGYFEQNAALYVELDRLRPTIEKERKSSTVSKLSVRAVADLRSRYMRQCKKPECQLDPLYAELTRELAQLYVAHGDALSARAESDIHREEGRYRAGLAQMMYIRQAEVGRQVREAWDKYDRAKERGMDDETARSMSGDPAAFEFDERTLLHPAMALPDYASAIDSGKVRSFAGIVRAVKKTGGMVEVAFKKDKYSYDEAYACKRTNRITRIDSDGSIHYEENCKYRKKTEVRENQPPVKLPENEARHLSPGQMVIGLSAEGEGRVVEVKDGDRVIQLRADRVN